MFALKKCITAFLLPPGLFIPILLFIAWQLHRRRSRGYALALVMVSALIWGVSTAPASRAMIASLEQGLRIPSAPRGDVIILLGGGVIDRVPDLSGSGTPSEDALFRVVTAARLQKQLGVPVIVSGGAVFAGPTPDAVIYRRFLVDLGVPAARILVEDQSRDTMENARYSGEILRKHGFRRPLLVTSAYHMRRSVAAFKRAGIEVMPVPAHIMTSEDAPTVWLDWLPGSGSMSGFAMALREQIGMLFYRLAQPEGS